MLVFKQPQLSLKITLKKNNWVAEPPPQIGVVRPPFFIFYFLRICRVNLSSSNKKIHVHIMCRIFPSILTPNANKGCNL